MKYAWLAAPCAIALFWGCSTSNIIAEEDGAAGAGSDGSGGSNLPDPPSCEPTGEAEDDCADGVDDDCDGFIDCRDSECSGEACSSDSAFSCTAGACLGSAPALPELPALENLEVMMNVDTARIEFEPVSGARDYRVYPLPADDDILVGENGEVVVQNAIYRCAGDRPMTKRIDDPAGFYDASLTADVFGYTRSEGEAILGYAYLVPGPDREPVYRLANPIGKGGHAWDYTTVPSSEYNSADYVVGEEARDARLAEGYRDDGIAFYAPTAGTVPVYRREYPADVDGPNPNSVIYYTDGPEYDSHEPGEDEEPEAVVDFSERFRLLETAENGAVPLYRVFYLADNAFDVLAAGDSRYERALEQGNLPLWSVTWPGLEGPTTLVVEALDQGCPFPNGYISYMDAPCNPETDGCYPSITLDEARLESGEVFINGTHDPANRPKPVARAFVEVTPEDPPEMDFFEGFDPGSEWADYDQYDTFNNGIFLRRNDDWVIEYSGCHEGNTVGPVLGQLVFGGGDYGSSCNMSIVPRGISPEIQSDTYLHMRMTTEIPSTHRRYPQVMLTTAELANVGDLNENDVPVRHRLGPLPFEETYVPHSGSEKTIIVQPFGSNHELQIQFCDGRGWGVSAQCPRANVYGYLSGSYEEESTEPWRPVPVLGEMAGHDRPVRFDVYVSTSRVYVTLDGKPAGCAVLPEGQGIEGPVTPIFGAVIYHGGIDEAVTEESSPHQYLRSYSLVHYDRKIDDLGIDLETEAPPWDESVLPCGTDWYGAEE